MNTEKTKAEQNFITCATNMQKFMHEYALISSGEFDEIGHTAMKHPVLYMVNCFDLCNWEDALPPLCCLWDNLLCCDNLLITCCGLSESESVLVVSFDQSGIRLQHIWFPCLSGWKQRWERNISC